jgi:hypothetical protein
MSKRAAVFASLCFFSLCFSEDSHDSLGLIERLFKAKDSSQIGQSATPLHSWHAISGEIISLPDMYSSYYYFSGFSSTSLAPSIGYRGYINTKTALGFSFWMNYQSGFKEDTSTSQPELPTAKQYAFSGTILREIYQSSKSYLAMLFQASILFNTDHAGYEKQIPTSTYSSYYSYRYIKYTTTSTSFYLALEPGYIFDSHFSLFSDFGIGVGFSPNHKYADQESPNYDPTNPNTVPQLKESRDAETFVGINYTSIGIRYYF